MIKEATIYHPNGEPTILSVGNTEIEGRVVNQILSETTNGIVKVSAYGESQFADSMYSMKTGLLLIEYFSNNVELQHI